MAASLDLDSQPLTHYIAVRKDLPRGLLAAAVTHAAGESSPGNLESGTNAVVLGLSGPELHAWQDRLADASVPHIPIIENDHPYEDVLVAVGLPPCARADVRSFTKKLPLLREADG